MGRYQLESRRRSFEGGTVKKSEIHGPDTWCVIMRNKYIDSSFFFVALPRVADLACLPHGTAAFY